MLPYLAPFCNFSSAYPIPTWRGLAATWRPPGRPAPAGRCLERGGVAETARLRRALQAAGHMPLGLSAPLRHMTRIDSPTPPSPGQPWWTPRLFVCPNTTSAHDALHGTDKPCRRRRAVAQTTRQRSSRNRRASWGWCAVVWGDQGLWFGETRGCGLERSRLWFGETTFVVWRDKI